MLQVALLDNLTNDLTKGTPWCSFQSIRGGRKKEKNQLYIHYPYNVQVRVQKKDMFVVTKRMKKM